MNTDLLKTLAKHFDQDAIQTLGQQIGAPREQAHSAINAALPVLVGMLAKNNESEAGHQALARAVERDHDGSILDHLGGFLSSGDTGMGEKILGHVLGRNQAPAQAGLAEQTGLQGDQVGKMMAMLAPVVMGALGQQARASSGSTAGSIGDLLQGSMGDLLKGSSGQAGGNVLGSLLGGGGSDLGGLAKAGSSLLGSLFKR
ncbi:MAG: DUF937 domain-containing protein [Pseudomonadota bacterium]